MSANNKRKLDKLDGPDEEAQSRTRHKMDKAKGPASLWVQSLWCMVCSLGHASMLIDFKI